MLCEQASPADPPGKRQHKPRQQASGAQPPSGLRALHAGNASPPGSPASSGAESEPEASEGYEPGPEASSASTSSELTPSEDTDCLRAEPDWEVKPSGSSPLAAAPHHQG